MRCTNGTWSLKSLILISCIGCMLLAMLLQMLLFNASSSAVITQQTAEINRNTLSNMSDEIYDHLKKIENSLISVYDHRAFVHDLGAAPSADTLTQQYASLAYEMANEAFETDEYLTALYLYTTDHQLISSYRHAQTPIYTYPADIYDRTMKGSDEGVRELIAQNPSVMAVTSYENTKRELRLVRCVLRILENAQTPIGYMVCDVDPKGFQAVMRKYQYSQVQAIWLQPEGAYPVVSVLPDDSQTQSVYGDMSAQVRLGSADAVHPEHHSLYSTAIRKYGIHLYSLIPTSALTVNQSMLMRSTAAVFVVVLLFFGVLFGFVSRGLTRPLTQMVDTMNRIKQGATELRLPPLRQDELGKLGSTFNDMLDRIEALIASQYQTTIQLNDTKYKALQMQVNPHFLYNTLDTMSAIAMARDCPLVSSLCHALSDLFHYSLRMDEPLAAIADELKHLKSYLYVINVRMNDGIQLTTHIPSEMMRAKLPRLSLQPLVENAIQHGLRNKRGEKRIEINANLCDGDILVDIVDNGVGMPQEALEKLQAARVEDALSTGNSIGLMNIHARVRLLFGEPYGLTVKSGANGGTIVTLRIPAGEEAERHAE